MIRPRVSAASGGSLFYYYLLDFMNRAETRPVYKFLGEKLKGIENMSKLIALLRDESGATAIEYGLIAAGISIAIIATVNALGTQLNTTFNSVSTQLH